MVCAGAALGAVVGSLLLALPAQWKRRRNPKTPGQSGEHDTSISG